eukprot:CAMPEP_0180749630 /NCGR_PEP_ID=MMETSP1038_2-20121128/30695_1 /TAXON_ID=632150 /ORGANISM="Azadinium spinosum, Strain 3D9" /LENGTH=292 /DNA_ID=CAMNT_0022783349 /DNA_START=98 /DNA_END=973 /DNA_ORIENTATION=-
MAAEESVYLEGAGVEWDADEPRARRRSKERSRPSKESTDVVRSVSSPDVAQQRSLSRGISEPRDIWLHIYHTDPYTGFLNRVALKRGGIGIYHAGVEIYGEEWAFQYFEETWNDPSVSGLTRCVPKHMPGYEYQESVYLGASPCSQHQVDQCLLRLHYEWPACSYHLTKRNCLTFAEHFAQLLQSPEPFPARLNGILNISTQHTDALVDYSWTWMKWWMMRKHNQVEEEEQSDRTRGGVLSWILQHSTLCTGPTLCPRENQEDALTSEVEVHLYASTSELPSGARALSEEAV